MKTNFKFKTPIEEVCGDYAVVQNNVKNFIIECNKNNIKISNITIWQFVDGSLEKGDNLSAGGQKSSLHKNCYYGDLESNYSWAVKSFVNISDIEKNNHQYLDYYNELIKNKNLEFLKSYKPTNLPKFLQTLVPSFQTDSKLVFKD